MRGTWLVAMGWMALAACGDDDVRSVDGGSHDAQTVVDAARDAFTPRDAAEHDTSTRDAAPNGDGGRDAATPANQHPTLAALPDNTVIDLGPIGCTAPEGEDDNYCRIATDYSGMVYDSGHHRMLVFGGGHASTMTDAIQAFDLSGTLTWSDLYTPTPCSRMTTDNVNAALGAWIDGPSGPYPRPVSAHTYDLVGYAPDQDEFLLIGRLFTAGSCTSISNDVTGPVAHYAFANNQWSFSSDDASRNTSNGIATSEYDPISKRFIALGSEGLVVYDPATRTASPQYDALSTSGGDSVDISALGYANHMVYFPPNDRFYYFLRGNPVRVYEVTLDRQDFSNTTIDLIDTSGPSSPHSEPGYDYDRKNEMIGGGVIDGVFYAFQPTTRTWTSHVMLGASDSNSVFHALAYDPINNVFIFRSANNTWAYRFQGDR